MESLPLLNQLAFSLFNGSLYILFAFATRGRGCITPDLRPWGIGVLFHATHAGA